uniref:Uncharacterized protein n=1 Tax=Romanomermis culicivorax TaxID=13658 RepID=A0A915L5A7_ROMCU
MLVEDGFLFGCEAEMKQRIETPSSVATVSNEGTASETKLGNLKFGGILPTAKCVRPFSATIAILET